MRLTPRERRKMIIAQVCERRGVSVEEVLGRSRFKSICSARKEAYVRLREENLSYPTIGKMFGRDHTTVIDGVKRHEREQHEGTKKEKQEPHPGGPKRAGQWHNLD